MKKWLIGLLAVAAALAQQSLPTNYTGLQWDSGPVATLPTQCGHPGFYWATDTSALYLCSDGGHYVYQVNGVGSVPFVLTSDHAGSIPASFAALPAGGGTVIVNGNVTSGSSIAIPSNSTLTCSPGVTITRTGTSAPLFTANGSSRFTITGCQLVGGNQTLQFNNVGDWWVTNNYISGWGTNAIATGRPAYDGHILRNTIYGCAAGCSDAIEIEDPTEKIEVDSNIIDTTGAANNGSGVGGKAISIHTFSSGGTANAVSLTNNKIHHAGGNFAIEVGSFGVASINPVQTVVIGNVITTTVANNGGISFNKVTAGTILGNQIDVGSTAPQIGAIEMANSSGTVISGNTVSSMPADGRAIIIDSSNGNRVVENVLNGLVFLVNSGTFSGVTDLSDNLFQGNRVILTTAGTWTKGAFFSQCNVTSCTATHNQWVNNRIVGIGTSASSAVYLETDSGSTDANQISGNTWTGFTNLYGASGSVTNTDLGIAPASTVVALQACTAAIAGARGFVTDSNAASFTAGVGAVVVGGGSVKVPVTCDGTNWRIG